MIKLIFDVEKKSTSKINFWWFLSTYDQVNASPITKGLAGLIFLAKINIWLTVQPCAPKVMSY